MHKENEKVITQGDASEITKEDLLKIEAKTKSHFLFIDLPTTNPF